ncbi:MAG TPA: ABC transporter permease [Pyrinomonadaceae bacterium]|nr:ABC transporter permease [Pyrinomonadaceae bacterium]
MDAFLNDVRYAFRNLIKRPAFTLIAAITLALGIGANTAIFSSFYALLLKPLPFPSLDKVVAVWDSYPSRGVTRNEVAMANYLDWQSQNQSFEQLALYRWWSANLTGIDPPERIQAFLITANFLDALGVKPSMGRNFTEDENQPGKDAVAILTHGLWQRRFGGDPNILGKTITLDGVARTIVGVMPEKFKYPSNAELYSPIAITPGIAANRQFNTYYVVGRLKPGASVQSAQADIDNITARLEQQYPETNTGSRASVFPIVADTVRKYELGIWMGMAAVGFVLLIACANVANLMLARASGRQKEIALRAALGASRWRIIRQLLTESSIVALLGGALGILIAVWGIEALRAANPGDAAKFAPGWDQLGINLTVLLFTVALSLLSGLLFGLAPALQVSKPNLNDAMKEGSRQTSGRSHRLRSSLVVAEVALSLVLLVGAGLFFRSFMTLFNTDPGFNPDNVLTMNLILPSTKYKDEQQAGAFYTDLVQRVKAEPGVQSAAAVNFLPLGGSNASDAYLVEGEAEPAPGNENIGRYRVCTADYFATMQIPVLKGRAFTEQDKTGAPPVVIVNETLARKHWPGQDAIGKRIRLQAPIENAPWMEVVGVIKDVRHELTAEVDPEYYLPYAQDVWRSMVIVARTTVDPASLAGSIRQEVWAIDKDQPVADVRTMQEVRSLSVGLQQFNSVMIGVFAAVALLLASIGIYGVMAFAVTQRTQEIGIRMALGARKTDVLRMVVLNGMRLAVLGLAIGLVASWALTRFVSNLLYGVESTDPLTFSVVSVCLLAAAFLACYLPARRATKVDPLEALRYE